MNKRHIKINSKTIRILMLCMTVLCVVLLSPVQSQAAFDKAKAKKNVTVTYKKLPDGVLAVYKNKNSTDLKLSASVSFNDGAKNSISKEKLKNLCLGGKSTATLFFPAPRDEYGNVVNYSSYKGSYSVSKSKYKNYSKKISTSYDVDGAQWNFAAANQSGKKLSNVHATAVFYDSNNKVVGCYTKYLDCYGKDAISQFTVSYTGSSQPSKAKLYIDWAY